MSPWEVPSNQNPIHKVLSTLSSHKVHALLIGGQACVFYGAAEFSRDTDFALLASDENLALLRGALRELQCRRVAMPPFDASYLLRGHGIHFRCYHPDAHGMRIDIISTMRGVDPFPHLWNRRTRFVASEGETYDLLSLPDLVWSKKTQQDKDWPMIRRLIEADYVGRGDAKEEDIRFWLLESRTPAMLVELAKRFPGVTHGLLNERLLLSHAIKGAEDAIASDLDREADREREADVAYWAPLRRELEALRHSGLPVEETV